MNHELTSDYCWNMFGFTSWMFVCWLDLNDCGCLWCLNEKWENWGFWWKWTRWWIWGELVLWLDVCCGFNFFFYVYKLVCKFGGRIWDQRDQKWGFWVKNWKFLRGNNQNRVTCSRVTRCGELHRAAAHVLGRFGRLRSIRAVLNWFFGCT